MFDNKVKHEDNEFRRVNIFLEEPIVVFPLSINDLEICDTYRK